MEGEDQGSNQLGQFRAAPDIMRRYATQLGDIYMVAGKTTLVFVFSIVATLGTTLIIDMIAV